MQNVLTHASITVLQPQGHFNASNVGELQQQLTSAANALPASGMLLVDMQQVESLDSAGLMALVSALSLTQRLDQRFSLCSVPPSIRIIFELTQLDRVFEIFEHRAAFEAAIA